MMHALLLAQVTGPDGSGAIEIIKLVGGGSAITVVIALFVWLIVRGIPNYIDKFLTSAESMQKAYIAEIKEIRKEYSEELKSERACWERTAEGIQDALDKLREAIEKKS